MKSTNMIKYKDNNIMNFFLYICHLDAGPSADTRNLETVDCKSCLLCSIPQSHHCILTLKIASKNTSVKSPATQLLILSQSPSSPTWKNTKTINKQLYLILLCLSDIDPYVNRMETYYVPTVDCKSY